MILLILFHAIESTHPKHELTDNQFTIFTSSSYKVMKQNHMQRRHGLHINFFFSETGKVAVSACITSSDIWWRQNFHE